MKKTEYSPFRKDANDALKRSKKKDLPHNIDKFYLKRLFDSQKGLCSLTRIKMKKKRGFLLSKSLDRIKPEKGYCKGNLRYVIRFVNLGSGDRPEGEILEILNLLKINYN
jgi:hypothetical protein